MPKKIDVNDDNDVPLEHHIERVLSIIQNDPEEAPELEEIVEMLLSNNIDINDLPPRLLKFLSCRSVKLQKKNISDDELSIYMSSEQLVHLVHNLNILSKLTSKQILSDKSKTDPKSLAAAQDVMKRFVVYELYKAANPNRIAGEAQDVNFKNNIILRGLAASCKLENITIDKAEKKYGREIIESGLAAQACMAKLSKENMRNKNHCRKLGGMNDEYFRH